jgi:hypothetical protein
VAIESHEGLKQHKVERATELLPLFEVGAETKYRNGSF